MPQAHARVSWVIAASLVSAIGWSPRAALAQCPALDTTESSGSFTITAPSYFKMVFSNALNGNLHEFYDLEQDPTLDLAGGTTLLGLFYDALGTGVIITNWDITAHTNAGKVDLLEATPTRVRLRQESFYKRLNGTTIKQGAKGFGDYSVYPTGRIALRWNRKTFTSVGYDRCELVLALHYLGSGPLSTWTPYTESGGSGFPHAGDRDFLLMTSDVPGSLTTDFLRIIYKDWTVANGYQKSATETTSGGVSSGLELTTMRWRDNTTTTIPAGTSEVWNFLTYFKPTNFADHLDPAVTGRRDDYRLPDTLTINVGSAWNDASENAVSDHFNESEAAYVLDLNPASGLDFSIDGGTGSPPTRYKPFFKIRQWRSLQDPTSVTLNGSPLTNGTDYQADVKPVSGAHFAQDLLWHSTLQDQASVDASPDVGSPGTVNGTTTWEAAKYGQGFLFDAAGENITFSSSGNFNLSQGSLDFWYQPRYAHTDGVPRVLWHNAGDASHYFLLEKTSADELKFTIQNGASATTATVTSSNYSWRNRDWVHLRVSWDAGAAAGLQARVLVFGSEPTHSDSGTYSTSGMIVGQNYIGSDSSGSNSANGITDEIFVYDAPAGPKLLAYGGLTSNASEYLADGTGGKNDSLPFLVVNGQKQGEYFFVGADSEFRGLNVALATAGAGASPILQWQYWNGTAWTNLTLSGDETNHLTKTGTIYWTDPADWTAYSVQGGPDLYYVRAYLASGDYSTQAPVEGLIKTDILLFQYCSDVTAAGENFVFSLPTPTAVDLAFFSAEGRNGMVELTWETGSELNNLGFHLYRAESEQGPYERITSSVIPGLGSSPEGARYRYTDTGLTNGVPYYYKLEDIETTGNTQQHGPVSATPEAGAEAPADDSSPSSTPESSPASITFGDPSAVSWRVLSSSPRQMLLELETGGFYAEPQSDGTVRLSIPDFVNEPEPGSPALPVKRAWVEALAGLRLRVASVEASEVVAFSGLRPSAADSVEVVASRNGTARVGRRRQSEGTAFRGAGLFPEEAARIVSVGFQGERKKALLELAPLRWDRASGQLLLARRLTVRLVYSGREAGERSLGGARGRQHRESPSHQARPRLARLLVREKGLYRVSYEEVFGFLRGREIEASLLRLSRQGKPVAFQLEPNGSRFGPGSAVYFLSEGAVLNPYGQEAVYELELAGGGTRMPVASAAPSGAALGFYWQKLSREENRYYQAGLLKAPDRWLWDVLFAPVTKSYPLELRELASAATEPALLELWLQGASDFEANPDHHLRVFVNGSLLAEESWDGKEPRQLRMELPPGLLREGENQLAIDNVGDTEAAYSMVMLDKWALSYPRLLVAEAGKLQGSFSESGEAGVSGLGSGAHLLDVTEEPARWLSGADSSNGSLRFRAEAGRNYLAVSAEAVLKPEVAGPLPSHLKSRRNRSDYLVVAPRAFLEVAQPLLDWRRTEGLAVRAVALEEVYSEFGFGESRPEALQEFLAYAYHHWRAPSPRYVLLLGDATYDFKDYLGTGVLNQVPPLMLKTTYLWTASDPAYGAVNGDDILPDVAIGRLPAATVDEARVMVEKILAYERAGVSLSGPLVLVADNPDEAGDFEADAEEIASSLLAGRNPRKIYLGQLGAEATRSTIVEAFEQGASLLSYMGHGGIHLWAQENIFNSSQVGLLAAQPLEPLVLTLNCLNGYYHFPYFNALGEELLKAEGKGALAAFSPSGLSLNGPAHLFHKALLGELLFQDHTRLGDAVLAAQTAYAETGAFPELLSIYHLLGDPAMKLR
jgi:hypothetical protein